MEARLPSQRGVTLWRTAPGAGVFRGSEPRRASAAS